jgi:hypothetical protein
VEAAREGGRVGLEAAGEVGDGVGGQRRAVDLSGLEQKGQSYKHDGVRGESQNPKHGSSKGC